MNHVFRSGIYFIPAIVGIPIGGFVEGYAGFIDSKNKSLGDNTMHTTFGIIFGMYKYGFLGLIWPITLPVLIGRSFNKTDIKKD
jgi:hypothetical protein